MGRKKMEELPQAVIPRLISCDFDWKLKFLKDTQNAAYKSTRNVYESVPQSHLEDELQILLLLGLERKLVLEMKSCCVSFQSHQRIFSDTHCMKNEGFML